VFWCCYDILLVYFNLILLTWTIWRAPTNASKWRMGVDSAFKGLIVKYSCSVSFFVLYSGNTDSNCVSFEKFLNLSLVCVPNCVAFWKKINKSLYWRHYCNWNSKWGRLLVRSTTYKHAVSFRGITTEDMILRSHTRTFPHTKCFSYISWSLSHPINVIYCSYLNCYCDDSN
jgi:hypothetical protein